MNFLDDFCMSLSTYILFSSINSKFDCMTEMANGSLSWCWCNWVCRKKKGAEWCLFGKSLWHLKQKDGFRDLRSIILHEGD